MLGKTSLLCSEHFAPDDFVKPLTQRFCVFPSIHAKREGEKDEPPAKKRREQRMVRKYSHTCSRHFM